MIVRIEETLGAFTIKPGDNVIDKLYAPKFVIHEEPEGRRMTIVAAEVLKVVAVKPLRVYSIQPKRSISVVGS